MTREETIKNLLTELIDMIDNGSQRDLDRADEISKTIIEALSQEPYICDTCKHKDDGWDTEPCDGCCGNHSGYEPCDRRKNHEEKPHSLLDAYFQMRKESE